MLTDIPGKDPIELKSYYHEFAWYYPNCELETKKWFVENAKRDWVYLDCGANIGYYSILFSRLSQDGHIYAVEPTITIEMMMENLAFNHCQNVSAFKLALGQHPGRRVEKIYRLWGSPPEEIEYEFTTIDIWVNELKIEKLDCIKIDVDSFDFEVLLGAEKTLERYDPWLVVELNHALGVRGYSNMGALKWLKSHGYDCALVLDNDNFILKRSANLPLNSNNFLLTFP